MTLGTWTAPALKFGPGSAPAVAYIAVSRQHILVYAGMVTGNTDKVLKINYSKGVYLIACQTAAARFFIYGSTLATLSRDGTGTNYRIDSNLI